MENIKIELKQNILSTKTPQNTNINTTKILFNLLNNNIDNVSNLIYTEREQFDFDENKFSEVEEFLFEKLRIETNSNKKLKEIEIENLKNLQLLILKILSKTYHYCNPNKLFWKVLKLQIKQRSLNDISIILTEILQIMTSIFDKKNIKNNEFKKSLRLNFMSSKSYKSIIFKCLRSEETIYPALMILWTLTFDEKVILNFSEEILENLLEILGNKMKGNNQRVCVYILNNLFMINNSNKPKKINSIDIKSYNDFKPENLTSLEKILKEIIKSKNKSLKNNIDNLNEITDDLKILLKDVQKKLETKTNYKNYLQEIFSGKIMRSNYHYNEKFWMQNIAQLNDNKKEVLIAFKRYLKSDSSEIVKITLNDLKMFMKFSSESEQVVLIDVMKSINLKEDLIELMNHHDGSVRIESSVILSRCLGVEWFN